ncbi:cyclic nucleotide-binding domain protein (macronuclear) [Tetrahymena thermophila SB210]|uniref:Cyclic nucleotide-binding domain protein n=1 Tax=Tetrahymena thermophila (strain SB210) TaxID=312017 RepID=I7M0D3_TETTS|nr:cyclic nucleotide-binding domain protein [Tetrahymena thermophila SB210]EAR87356.2 cyclic nucleotide-binding domain protein [Tetrahymena thermophila SB210]|eukprot:XP_001007601.2 cyclic nucleotide-binding domain protein [Tetrahymena thermophila SB210]
MKSLFKKPEDSQQIDIDNTSEEEKDYESQQVNFSKLGGLKQPLINGVGQESIDQDIIDYHQQSYTSTEQKGQNNQTRQTMHKADNLSQSNRQHIEEQRQPYIRKSKKENVVCFQKRQTYLKNMKIYNALYNFTPPNQRIQNQVEQVPLIQQIIEKIPVFEPSNVYLLYWEFMIFILTCIIFFFIPIELFFQTSIIPTEGMGLAIRILLFIAFILDIIFYLNTGFFDRGKLILDRKKIFMNYLKKFFDGKILVDILGITGLSLNLFQNDRKFGIDVSSYFCLLFYVRIINLNSFDTVIIQQLQLHRKSKAAYQLLRLGIIVLFISNFFACVFYRVGVIECEYYDGKCWFSKIGVDDPSTLQYYLYALYWSITTMISVGYGDVTPVAPYEVLVCIFSMMCSCILFAYSINSIWFIISEVSQGTQRYQQNMNAMNRYMRDKGIDPQLSKKINGYLDFVWKDTKSREDDKEKKIIQSLPQNLKLQLIYQANSFFFKKYEWSKHFSYGFLQLLAQFITEKKYLEDDLLYHQDEQEEDQYLYYVEQGEVQLYYDMQFYNNGQGIPIQSIESGNFIGLYEFFSGEKKHESARCIELTNVFAVSRNDFLKIIKNFPEDYQKYVKLKDQMVYQKNYKLFGLKCFLCDKEDHLSHQCVEVQLKKDALKKHQMQLHPELFMNLRQDDDDEDRQIQDIPSLYQRGFSQTLNNINNSEHIKENQKYYDINLRLKFDCKLIKKGKHNSDKEQVRLSEKQTSNIAQKQTKNFVVSSQEIQNSSSNVGCQNQRQNENNQFGFQQQSPSSEKANQNMFEQKTEQVEYLICDDDIRNVEENFRKSRVRSSLYDVMQTNQIDNQKFVKSHDVNPVQQIQQSHTQPISVSNTFTEPIKRKNDKQLTQNYSQKEKVNLNQIGLQREQQRIQEKNQKINQKEKELQDEIAVTKQNIKIQRRMLSYNQQQQPQLLLSSSNLQDNFQNSQSSNKQLTSFDNLNYSPSIRPINKNLIVQKTQKQQQPIQIEFQNIKQQQRDKKSQQKEPKSQEEQKNNRDQKKDLSVLVTTLVQKLIADENIISEENAQSFISRKNEAEDEEDIDLPPKEDAEDLNYIFYKYCKKN